MIQKDEYREKHEKICQDIYDRGAYLIAQTLKYRYMVISVF